MTSVVFIFLTLLLYTSTILMLQLKFIIGYLHTTIQNSITNQKIRTLHIPNFNLPKCYSEQKNHIKTVCILLNYAN